MPSTRAVVSVSDEDAAEAPVCLAEAFVAAGAAASSSPPGAAAAVSVRAGAGFAGSGAP